MIDRTHVHLTSPIFVYWFLVYSIFHFSFFFFNDPAPTEIYTLSLHDALPISPSSASPSDVLVRAALPINSAKTPFRNSKLDRKSTRLNSSHLGISYAVFCLKKKKKN